MRSRLDPFAVAAAVLALGMAVVYLWLMHLESDRPVAWFLAALLLGAGAAGYGASTGSPHRGAALILAGVVLAVLGVLAMFSIGLPVLAAGALCLFSAALRKSPLESG